MKTLSIATLLFLVLSSSALLAGASSAAEDKCRVKVVPGNYSIVDGKVRAAFTLFPESCATGCFGTFAYRIYYIIAGKNKEQNYMMTNITWDSPDGLDIAKVDEGFDQFWTKDSRLTQIEVIRTVCTNHIR